AKEQWRDVAAARLSVGYGQNPQAGPAAPLDADDTGALAQVDALGAQAAQHAGGKLRVLPGERFPRLDNGHPRAETAKGLGKGEPVRTAANHDQVAGQPDQVENRFGG